MAGHTRCVNNFNFIASYTMNACFTAFDKDRDGYLNLDEFKRLCQALFRNEHGQSYDVNEELLQDIFRIFDTKNDNRIDRDEFGSCWNDWIKVIVRPVSAILIVDVQNDFISGSLSISYCPAKHDGEDVIRPINRLLNAVNFHAVYYSYDWHPTDHVSFIDNVSLRKFHESSPVTAKQAKVFDTVVFDRNPPMSQKLWPRHCVQNTWGAELHRDLRVVQNAIKVYKGANPDVDSYSLFWDNQKLSKTTLDDQLRAKNITDVYLCGIAYDVCVLFTAKDAIEAGYRTILVDDCCRGVDLLDIEKTKNFVTDNHGVVVDSGKVEAMVKGNDRRPELAYKLALEIKKRRQ